MGGTITSRRNGVTSRALANHLEDALPAFEHALAVSPEEPLSQSTAANDEAIQLDVMVSLSNATRAARPSISKPNARYNHDDRLTMLLQVMIIPPKIPVYHQTCSQL